MHSYLRRHFSFEVKTIKQSRFLISTMFRRHRSLVHLLLLTAATFLLPSSALAQNPPLYNPVLLGVGGDYHAATNYPIQVRPDGSGVQGLAIAGDLSRTRFGGKRLFLNPEERYAGSLVDDLVVYKENDANRTILTDPTDNFDILSMAPQTSAFPMSSSSWSNNGQRVAFLGRQLEADGVTETPDTAGVYVADLVLDDAGLPSGLTNLRRVAAHSWADLTSSPAAFVARKVTFMSDDQRVVYFSAGALYVANINTTGSVQITIANLPDIPIKPLACPVAGDNRIAFMVRTPRNDGTNPYELYTVEVPAGYSGATLTAKQITTKKNTSAYLNIQYTHNYDWSPDGLYLGFSARKSTNTWVEIQKIRSNGSGSASSVLSSRTLTYFLAYWR